MIQDKKTKTTVRYSKNCFKIKGRQDLYIKDQILVSFAPIPKKKGIVHPCIVPKYNNDRRYYSVAFTIPYLPQQDDEEMREQHQRRVSDALKEIEQIYEPKPRSKHKYCGVCRGYYDQYKQHLATQKHKICLRNAQYQKKIISLAEQVQSANAEYKQQQQKNNELISEQFISKTSSAQTNFQMSQNQGKLLSTSVIIE